MSLSPIVVFGGTGAQAGPIVRHLSATNKFFITVPTRNTSSESAVELTKLPNVKLLEANYESEEGLRASFSGQESCYFIINSFAIREADEYFWTIRAYEIAVQSGIKHFVYSGARNRLRDNDFQEQYRNSHNVVKAHLSDWIRQQDTKVMGWSIVYGGVYAEMLGSVLCPLKMGDEFIFAAPVNEESVIPLMPLDNYGATLTWVLANASNSIGRFVDAGAIPSTWPEIVAAFVEVTGKKARFQPISQDQWFEGASEKGINPDAKLPHGAKDDDPATFTFRRTFGAWWNMWRDNRRKGEDAGRDAALVEGRIATLKGWMVKTDYQGEYREPTKMRREAAAAS